LEKPVKQNGLRR